MCALAHVPESMHNPDPEVFYYVIPPHTKQKHALLKCLILNNKMTQAACRKKLDTVLLKEACRTFSFRAQPLERNTSTHCI